MPSLPRHSRPPPPRHCSFPPDKGNVGTAAYLNVFGSIYRVLKQLKSEVCVWGGKGGPQAAQVRGEVVGRAGALVASSPCILTYPSPPLHTLMFTHNRHHLPPTTHNRHHLPPY